MTRFTHLLATLLLLTCAILPATPAVGSAQTTAPPHTSRPTSTPYSGDLSIFEYPDRDKKLQIDRVMDLLAIHSGSTVADLGAGSGWFSVRAARRVGSSGTVFAEDINPDAIHYIDDRARKEKLANIHTIAGTPDDPRLPVNAVDAVLLLKVYHEIAHPIPVMRLVHASLRPGALVGIIDRNGTGADHGVDRKIVEKEMAQAGYRLAANYDFTKADGQDYFLIFTPGGSIHPDHPAR